MTKREENPFLNSFEFRCGDLPKKDIPDAARYLFLKGFMSLLKEKHSSIDLSRYELVPFEDMKKRDVSL